MAKRNCGSGDEIPYRKRQKLTKDLAPKQETPNIQSSKDLSLLLSFKQDAGPHTRQGIQSFRLFLDSIAYAKESIDRSAKLELLLGYLRSQAASNDEENFTYLADVIKTWHFSVQSNVENLFSSVVTVLALLLKTISSLIEFRKYGNHLCRTLLHDDQVKLFDRGFSANKSKEYVIAPCLRLLTEVISFDGGHAARCLFRQRETTFKRLETFLGIRKASQGGESHNCRRPSLREHALRYLHANLHLQHSTAKMYILAQGRIVRAWVEVITEDPPSFVLEILGILKKDVALDSAIDLSAKSRFFNEWVLGRLATLYSYKEAGGPSQGDRSVQRSVHEFLLFICTSPRHGIFNTRNEDHLDCARPEINMNTGRNWNFSTQNKTHGSDQAIRGNGRLSSFLQTLRPHANVMQSDLVIAIFRKKPELVADYFSRRTFFPFDPKATATWVGYSSFLLATVQIPLPETLRLKSAKVPIPSSYENIIESIIPLPLTKRVLTRCLNQSTDLIKFLAIRILNAAFDKIAKVLEICSEMQTCVVEKRCAVAWDLIISKLSTDFCERVPDMEFVISQFRSCPKENVMLRESITRLLCLYYEVVPQAALEQKFDISVALSAALENQDSHAEGTEDIGMRLLELEHLLVVTHCSPNMQWFHKPDSMRLSLITMLLKMHRNRSRTNPNFQSYSQVVESVAIANHILNSHHSLNTLNLSLQDVGTWRASNNVFDFLDDCILRLVRKPVHYFDLLTNLVVPVENEDSASNFKLDLLLVVVMEQWPFLAKRVKSTTLNDISMWLVRYIEMLGFRLSYNSREMHDSGPANLLSQIRSRIRAGTENKACRRMIKKGWETTPELVISEQTMELAAAGENSPVTKPDTLIEEETQEDPVNLVPSGPPQEDKDHPGLIRWSREDIPDAISEGATGDLFLCLCSEHVEIRKEALSHIEAFMKELEKSRYSEWLQIFVLAGEVAKTARCLIGDIPLPYFAGALAAHSLLVQVDPLHFMYPKVNKFLNKGPQWNVEKLLSYWVDRILLSPPTEDEAHYREIAWLLDILVDGLRTPADMEIYRHCSIFERLLALSGSPSLPKPTFGEILDLLFRCTYVEGSTTLITRCAVISWISSRLTLNGTGEGQNARLRALAWRLYETCDRAYVGDWSNGTMAFTLNSL